MKLKKIPMTVESIRLVWITGAETLVHALHRHVIGSPTVVPLKVRAKITDQCYEMLKLLQAAKDPIYEEDPTPEEDQRMEQAVNR